MRNLYLLRHAKSSWDDPGVDDFDRPLSGRGYKAATLMAAFLAEAHIRPALALVSAARRTRDTWEVIEPAMRGVPVAFEDELYEAGKGELMERLRRLDDHLASVLVLGHNPGLERFAQALIHGHGDTQAVRHLAAKFPTGALAVLDTDIAHWKQLDAGTCRLSKFIRPKDLE